MLFHAANGGGVLCGIGWGPRGQIPAAEEIPARRVAGAAGAQSEKSAGGLKRNVNFNYTPEWNVAVKANDRFDPDFFNSDDFGDFAREDLNARGGFEGFQV